MFDRRNADGNRQVRDGLPSVDELAVRYGFRRVERVHIRTVGGTTVATVTAIVHRYPRSVRVPLSVASRLVAAGAPLTVSSTGSRAGTG